MNMETIWLKKIGINNRFTVQEPNHHFWKWLPRKWRTKKTKYFTKGYINAPEACQIVTY
jgi:hypothetical protein